MQRAFTLLEFLLVVGIMIILVTITLPLALDFYKNQLLDISAKEIIQTLRRAQLKAMAVERDSSFGVYFTDQNYTLFKGDSFLTRDTLYDEVFDLPEIINVSGLKEIIFLKSGGIPKESPAYCGGICTPCSDFTDRISCLAQDGCIWIRSLQRCTGTCTSCENYQNQTDCQNQSGCLWYPPAQGGDIILSTNGQIRKININEVGRINLE